MEQKNRIITNGKIVTPSGIIPKGSIWISEGKIKRITDGEMVCPEAETIDAMGNYVAPGCIDTHVHGGGGHDFMEATPTAFYTAARAHARHGTTAIYPTLAVSPIETFYNAIRTCEQVMDHPEQGARIMGLHLEGNYLNLKMKGGQDPNYITLPDPEEYQQILDSTSCVKRWSAAPELEGALPFARYASSRGVLVSVAHTEAGYSEIQAAFEAGFTHATHFYNAMTSVHKNGEYKQEGTIESIYLTDGMSVEVIADGIHVPPALLRLVYKLKGVERTTLVTDAMSAAAWAEATHVFDPRVIIEDGVCKLADRSALAGSIATADRLIRTLIQQAGIPLTDAVRMASETPARIMGILHKKGTLEVGKDADIIIFDPQINILATLVEGTVVYRI